MAPTNSASALFNVNGLVAVITGGGSGLGLYAARALDANGAKAVYIIGRRKEVLESAAASGVNGTIKPLVGDVTDVKSLQSLTAQIESEVGYINLLFANAGVMGPRQSTLLSEVTGGKRPPTVQEFSETLLKADPQEFTNALHVNITGVFLSTAAFLPLLDKGNQKGNVPQESQVLVTSSIAGFSRALASSFSYSTSKAGATHLVKMMSTNFAQSGYHIRVNAIAPGLFPSEMTEGLTKEMQAFGGPPNHPGVASDALVMSKDRSPAERTGSEEDFAGTILYACSRAGAYLNGEVLVLDGGRLAQLPSAY